MVFQSRAWDLLRWALAILGVLSIWLRGAFWVAPAIGRSVFLLGAAYVHIRDIVTRGNFAPGNAGSILFFDIALPIIVLSLLTAYIRMGGLKPANPVNTILPQVSIEK